MNLDCAQKQRHPHGEGFGFGQSTAAEPQKETPPEGGVGPEMLSPAGHKEKRPHGEGVGLAMLSPAGLTRVIMVAQACAVKALHRDPRFAGGERCRA
ncbi:MAG: hypothetical protein JG774_1022 [Desulfomicrobiaceae bacterium]|nr:hypothetical protein [Desulfomicrobiaceae bacterium]